MEEEKDLLRKGIESTLFKSVLGAESKEPKPAIVQVTSQETPARPNSTVGLISHHAGISFGYYGTSRLGFAKRSNKTDPRFCLNSCDDIVNYLCRCAKICQVSSSMTTNEETAEGTYLKDDLSEILVVLSGIKVPRVFCQENHN